MLKYNQGKEVIKGNMDSRFKRAIRYGAYLAAQFAAGLLTLLLTIVCVYYPATYAWKILTHQFDTRTTMMMVLGFVLVNLIVYQLISVVVAHRWHTRNKDYRRLNMPQETKEEIMRLRGLPSEEDLKLGKPSILATALFHSSFALQMIKEDLIDGPHMRRHTGEKVNGIIKSKRFFEFAAFKGELYNPRFFCRMFQPQYMPYVVMTAVLMYLSLFLWCLIPFRIAMQKHFIMVNQFVIQFSDLTVSRLRCWKVECDEDYINTARNLQELRRSDFEALRQ